MAVGSAGSDSVSFESPRNSAVSTDSGIVLFQSSPEQQRPNYHRAANLRPCHPCISPYVNSRLFFDARNENVRISSSNETINSNADHRQMFSRIISKLARHPWTESTEFTELWSDIPHKSVNRNLADHQEQKVSENGVSISDVVANSNKDYSQISLVLRKHLWTDIPSELDIIQNRTDILKQLVNQNGVESSNISLLKDVSDRNQNLATTSGIFSNFRTESEKLKELSSSPPNDSVCNQNYSNYSEQNKTDCYRNIQKIIYKIQSVAVKLRYHVIVLAMQILLSLVPISAIYMGGVHIGTCPANEGATNLVYITGIAGLFLIGCHIAYTIAYHFINDWKEPLRATVRIMRIITVILMILEMIVFYSMSPSFENSENYCDKIFYVYTFYMNFAAAGIVFLSILLQYTSCKHQVENEIF